MDTGNWLVIAILVGALILFVLEKPRVDVVALLVLVACVATGLVDPREAFAGFADPAVVTVWTIFILSGGITRTGVADRIGTFMMRMAGNSSHRLLIVMMVLCGTLSAFMNNIGAVAILLPAVMSACREMRIPPSKMLMPLAVASLLGGTITLIGTPPNLIAAAAMEQAGVEPFGFFDFTPTGIVVLVVGLLYMIFIGHRLLPENTSGDQISEGYSIREYLREAIVLEESPMVWQKINRIRFGDELDVAIVYIRRGEEFLQQASDRRLRVNDVILLEGVRENVELVCEQMQWELKGRVVGRRGQMDEQLSGSGDLVEITLSPRSKFRRKTLRELGFRSRYGVTILAIRHEGEPIASNVVDVPLRFGDVMLAQGSEGRLARLRSNPNLLFLDNQPPATGRRPELANIAILILVLTLGSVFFVSRDAVAAVMLFGSICMVLSGALKMDEAYQAIDWKSVFLIAGMLPLGAAMENTGTAELIANGMIQGIGGMGPIIVLCGIFILATGLTSVISNAAAAVLIVPIAINAARVMDVNPEAFVMTTVIAASSAFLLPIGHQANIIIYGPGGYRFLDFVKVGIWLNLLLLLVVAFIVPLIFPL